ncbi:hypothetical protein HK099_004537 [Clydaea vesicula]|uniref:TIP41-like protein n=1 Tax=Clydaea vesicula TaxID=447962 RepID=A0AAD5U0K3_9FUNG|nr:hypothetical protein HK099_004537 [Clydaea vesicula]KAJ3379654.1 hypothetical protein HDU92_006539 [Lobulomyces angularis]
MERDKIDSNLQQFELKGFRFFLEKAPILNSNEIDELQNKLEFPLPEMLFGNSYLKIVHKNLEITFDPKESLNFLEKDSKLKVSYSKRWEQSAEAHKSEIKEIIKPYDWTYSTNYTGTFRMLDKENNHSDALFEKSDTEINVENLKKQNPILFYGEMVLFEDELADNGTAIFTLRVRVMDDCFFILLRFFLRLDNVLFRINDTRIYHEFDKTYLIKEFSSTEADYSLVKQSLPKPNFEKNTTSHSNEDLSLLTDPNFTSSILNKKGTLVKKTLEKLSF